MFCGVRSYSAQYTFVARAHVFICVYHAEKAHGRPFNGTVGIRAGDLYTNQTSHVSFPSASTVRRFDQPAEFEPIPRQLMTESSIGSMIRTSIVATCGSGTDVATGAAVDTDKRHRHISTGNEMGQYFEN